MYFKFLNGLDQKVLELRESNEELEELKRMTEEQKIGLEQELEHLKLISRQENGSRGDMEKELTSLKVFFFLFAFTCLKGLLRVTIHEI